MEKTKVGRPLKFQDLNELQEKIDEYFDSCDKEGDPYTLEELALWLECDPKTLRNYAEREEFFPTISRAKTRIYGSWIKAGLKRQYSEKMVLFLLAVSDRETYSVTQRSEDSITVSIEDRLREARRIADTVISSRLLTSGDE